MLVILLPFLKRFSSYLMTAGICLVAGGYAGFRFEVGAVEVQKLALATQQKSDAAAIAAANAVAASELAQADANANAAETRLASVHAEAGVQETMLSSKITAQAARPGQDAPDSPVLAATLDDLSMEHP